jgi:hypothetical protein
MDGLFADYRDFLEPEHIYSAAIWGECWHKKLKTG